MEIKTEAREVVDVGAIANEIKAKLNGVDRVLTKTQRAMGLQIDSFGRLTTAGGNWSRGCPTRRLKWASGSTSSETSISPQINTLQT